MCSPMSFGQNIQCRIMAKAEAGQCLIEGDWVVYFVQYIYSTISDCLQNGVEVSRYHGGLYSILQQ